MPTAKTAMNWGEPPWKIKFRPKSGPIPETLDCAVVGAGFSGLSAAAWLRRLDPEKSVAVFEGHSIGAGASGRTGGMTLAETAAGDLPGLGDVLAGVSAIVKDLDLDCDLALPGAYELARENALEDSPIAWTDNGNLCATKLVPGGTQDPGKLVGELARVAEGLGARIFEGAEVEHVSFEDPLVLNVGGRRIQAQRILFATNAMSLELTGLADRTEPKFTLAVATTPLEDKQLEALGLASGRPFYTVDFPYLWGRLLPNNAVLFGAGLVHMGSWQELARLDVAKGQAGELIANLKRRVRGLHSALRDIHFDYEWGGPILIPPKWQPVFAQHPQSSRAIVLGAFAGHGVALSVYLGKWAAEVILGRRALPNWGFPEAGAKVAWK